MLPLVDLSLRSWAHSVSLRVDFMVSCRECWCVIVFFSRVMLYLVVLNSIVFLHVLQSMVNEQLDWSIGCFFPTCGVLNSRLRKAGLAKMVGMPCFLNMCLVSFVSLFI